MIQFQYAMCQTPREIVNIEYVHKLAQSAEYCDQLWLRQHTESADVLHSHKQN